MCWESKKFYWKGRPGGKQQGKGTQENSSVTWLAVSHCMVMGLVSRLSFLFGLKSPPWWCMPCSAKMDAREKDSGRWSDMWCLLLSFPELFLLVVAYYYSLPGPPVVKQLMQMVTMVPGQGGRFQSVCFP